MKGFSHFLLFINQVDCIVFPYVRYVFKNEYFAVSKCTAKSLKFTPLENYCQCSTVIFYKIIYCVNACNVA